MSANQYRKRSTEHTTSTNVAFGTVLTLRFHLVLKMETHRIMQSLYCTSNRFKIACTSPWEGEFLFIRLKITFLLDHYTLRSSQICNPYYMVFSTSQKNESFPPITTLITLASPSFAAQSALGDVKTKVNSPRSSPTCTNRNFSASLGNLHFRAKLVTAVAASCKERANEEGMVVGPTIFNVFRVPVTNQCPKSMGPAVFRLLEPATSNSPTFFSLSFAQDSPCNTCSHNLGLQ